MARNKSYQNIKKKFDIAIDMATNISTNVLLANVIKIAHDTFFQINKIIDFFQIQI